MAKLRKNRMQTLKSEGRGALPPERSGLFFAVSQRRKATRKRRGKAATALRSSKAGVGDRKIKGEAKKLQTSTRAAHGVPARRGK